MSPIHSHEKCRKQSKPLTKFYIYERQKWDDDNFFVEFIRKDFLVNAFYHQCELFIVGSLTNICESKKDFFS